MFFAACDEEHSQHNYSLNIDCNPYLEGELLLECGITLHPEVYRDYNILIVWYHVPFSPTNKTSSNLLSMGDADIKLQVLNDTKSSIVINSALKLHMLNETHTGSYSCIVNLTHSVNANADNIIRNVSVILSPATTYAHLNSCALNESQFREEIECYLPVATTPTSSSSMSPALASTSLRLLSPTTKSSVPTDALPSASDGNAGRMRHLKQFYIAVGVVGVFGSVIATLSLVVVCTCVKYRKMLKGMDELKQLFRLLLNHTYAFSMYSNLCYAKYLFMFACDYIVKEDMLRSQDSIRALSTIPSDYLVPVASQSSSETSLAATGTFNNSSTDNADNPTYIPTALLEQLVMSYSTNGIHQISSYQQPAEQEVVQHQFPQHLVAVPDHQQSVQSQPPQQSSLRNQFQPLHAMQHQFYEDQLYRDRYEMPLPPLLYSEHNLQVPLPQASHGEAGQRKSDVFLHSYESIKSPHDYEELMESENYENPVTMIKNDAYTASNTYTVSQS